MSRTSPYRSFASSPAAALRDVEHTLVPHLVHTQALLLAALEGYGEALKRCIREQPTDGDPEQLIAAIDSSLQAHRESATRNRGMLDRLVDALRCVAEAVDAARGN